MPQSKSSENFCVAFPLEVAQKIRALASKRSQSSSVFIRDAVYSALKLNGYKFDDYNPPGQGARSDLRYPTREEIDYQLEQIDKRRKQKGNRS